jgi:hypothetical protein
MASETNAATLHASQNEGAAVFAGRGDGSGTKFPNRGDQQRLSRPVLLLLLVAIAEHEKLVSVTSATEFGPRIHTLRFQNTARNSAFDTLATTQRSGREGGSPWNGTIFEERENRERSEVQISNGAQWDHHRGAAHKEQRREQTDKQQHAKHGRTLQKKQQEQEISIVLASLPRWLACILLSTDSSTSTLVVHRSTTSNKEREKCAKDSNAPPPPELPPPSSEEEAITIPDSARESRRQSNYTAHTQQ